MNHCRWETVPMRSQGIRPLLLFSLLFVAPQIAIAKQNGIELSDRIAFIRLVDDYWQIHMLENGITKQLTHSPIDKRNPSWFPDGRAIVYRTTSGTLQSISLVDGKLENLVPTDGVLVDPKLSPSGDALVFARFESEPDDNTNVYLYRFKDKELMRLTSETTLEYAPALSGDQRYVAYIGGRGFRSHFLKIIDLKSRETRVLQKEVADDMWPAFSPDSQTLVFASNRLGDYDLWRINVDGTSLSQLTFSPGMDNSPCFSPSGRHLAFVSNREGIPRVFTMAADGSDQLPVEEIKPPARDPAWWRGNTSAKEGGK